MEKNGLGAIAEAFLKKRAEVFVGFGPYLAKEP